MAPCFFEFNQITFDLVPKMITLLIRTIIIIIEIQICLKFNRIHQKTKFKLM